jgi:hypothetical protein
VGKRAQNLGDQNPERREATLWTVAQRWSGSKVCRRTGDVLHKVREVEEGRVGL